MHHCSLHTCSLSWIKKDALWDCQSGKKIKWKAACVEWKASFRERESAWSEFLFCKLLPLACRLGWNLPSFSQNWNRERREATLQYCLPHACFSRPTVGFCQERYKVGTDYSKLFKTPAESKLTDRGSAHVCPSGTCCYYSNIISTKNNKNTCRAKDEPILTKQGWWRKQEGP